MSRKRDVREVIVDTALALAEERSWESVHLHEVAAEAGLTLEDVRLHFRDKDDIADAWFDRADRAMLRAAGAPEAAALPSRVRLHRAVMAWLDALAPHRRVTRQMIRSMLGPGQFHVQLPALLRIGRTVRWAREAAGCDAVLPRRMLEEAATGSVFVSAFVCWLGDGSPASRRTRRLLDTLLGTRETAVPAPTPRPAPRSAPPHPAGEHAEPAPD